MSDKTGAPEAPDPYVWTAPDAPRETWSDADWLRAEARANFVTEDIERADRIADQLGQRSIWLCQTHPRSHERGWGCPDCVFELRRDLSQMTRERDSAKRDAKEWHAVMAATDEERIAMQAERDELARWKSAATEIDGPRVPRAWYVLSHTIAAGHPPVREWQTFSSREIAEKYRDGIVELHRNAGHYCVATVCEGEAMEYTARG
jgi:hypothetical protein